MAREHYHVRINKANKSLLVTSNRLDAKTLARWAANCSAVEFADVEQCFDSCEADIYDWLVVDGCRNCNSIDLWFGQFGDPRLPPYIECSDCGEVIEFE